MKLSVQTFLAELLLNCLIKTDSSCLPSHMCNRLFLFSFHRCFLRSAPKWSTIYCKLIQGLTGSSWTFLLAVPYRLYVDSLPQASVSGTDVCCCLQSLEGALLPSCLRTRCGSTRGLSTAASIFIWRCSDAFVKGWLPPLIWPLISLYFLSYWVVPQRGCYCRGFSVCTFLKKRNGWRQLSDWLEEQLSWLVST